MRLWEYDFIVSSNTNYSVRAEKIHCSMHVIVSFRKLERLKKWKFIITRSKEYLKQITASNKIDIFNFQTTFIIKQ